MYYMIKEHIFSKVNIVLMPLIRGNEHNHGYYKWGQNGHKYYYIRNNDISRERAKNLALKQMRAIKSSEARVIRIKNGKYYPNYN